MIIPMAIGSALSAFSAQNIGAGKPERAFSGAKLGVLLSLAFAIPATLVGSLASNSVVSLIVSEDMPELIAASAGFLIPFSWDCLFVSFVFCINGFMNGCGITTFVAVHETVAAFAVRIPLSIALSHVPSAALSALERIGLTLPESQRLFYVGIGTPAATLASLIMLIVYYRVRLSGGRLARFGTAGG
jgi:Na+-driven multidrug efflux pump